jgi:ankyrin repeat protein
MMVRIFISYRRDDTAGHAGRLFDRLAQRFGKSRVYRDLDSIDAGADFLETIRAQVRESDVLLALIGPRWITAADVNGHWRLASDDDLVRTEIVTALGSGTRVIPVLLAGAKMPEARNLPGDLGKLARLNAVEIRDSHFDQDVAELEEILGRPRWRRWVGRVGLYAAAAVLIATAGTVGVSYWESAVSPDQARINLSEMGYPYTPEAFVDRAAKSDARAVELFLRAGMDPNATGRERQTALTWAARNGQTSMVRLLLDRGARVDPALPAAAGWGRAEILEMLMSRHPSPAALNEALFAAATSDDTSILQTLLRHGVDVNARDAYGDTPLMDAARRANVAAVRVLLTSGADPDATVQHAGRNGWTALHSAARADPGRDPVDSVATARALLDRDAKVDRAAQYVNSTAGWTPLLVAVHEGHPAVAAVLLERGANPNARTEYGDGATALLLSIQHKDGAEEEMQALVLKGANINAANDKGVTPLMKAADERLAGIAKVLIERGASVDARDHAGHTALMFAAGSDARGIVDALLAAGAQVNAKNDNGGTALIWAARAGATDIAERLAARGAELNAATRTGMTALMVAAEEGNSDTVRTLLARGADPARTNQDGQTALMLAEAKRDEATALVLRARAHSKSH